jgi:hypothetical protein
MVNRQEQYFFNRPDLKKGFKDVVNYVHGHNIQEVRLSIGKNTWEYPFWVLFNTENVVRRFEHVGDFDMSYPLGEFLHDYVISVSQPQTKIDFRGHKYVKVFHSDPVGLFERVKDPMMVLVNMRDLFQKFLSLDQEAQEEYVKLMQISSLSRAHLSRWIEIRSRQLDIVKCMDIDLLNEIFPNFGDLMEDYYTKGIQNLKVGYYYGNNDIVNNAQKIIRIADNWFHSNRKDIIQAYQMWLNKTAEIN